MTASLMNMNQRCFLLLMAIISLFGIQMGACTPKEEEFIPLPTSICIRAMHHDVPLPDVNLFFKYNTNDFPGYDQPATYYDTLIVTDAQGRGCISPVPPGKHWLVALGASEHGIPLPVFGRMPIVIDLDRKPVVDTLLYMYE